MWPDWVLSDKRDFMTAQLLTNGAATLSDRFPVWLCDVWGVVHDGVVASRKACDALQKHRKAGGRVVFITNAPRPSTAILPQLEKLKVPFDSFDAIVSSGDVTRRLVSAFDGQRVFHLGPEKDLALLEGLPVNFTALDEADAVLCSGLYDDKTETVEDYEDVLVKMRAAGPTMICANPDKVVRYGDRLIPCAGALAERYEEIGGQVNMAGKPFDPIYDEALRQASLKSSQSVSREAVLAIGDGMATDAAGAANYGVALLFVINGIHERELANHGLDAIGKQLAYAAPGVELAGVTTELAW